MLCELPDFRWILMKFIFHKMIVEKERKKDWKKERKKHSNKNNNSWIALHFFSPKAQDIFTEPSKKSTSVVPVFAIWHGCWVNNFQACCLLCLVVCLSPTIPKELRGNSFCRNDILKFFCSSFRRHVTQNLTGLRNL